MSTDTDILRDIRIKIQGGREEFICNALERCSVGTLKQREALIKWISSMLGSRGIYRTYNSWCSDHHRITFVKMTDDDFRDGRLQWIDWMISELEPK